MSKAYSILAQKDSIVFGMVSIFHYQLDQYLVELDTIVTKMLIKFNVLQDHTQYLVLQALLLAQLFQLAMVLLLLIILLCYVLQVIIQMFQEVIALFVQLDRFVLEEQVVTKNQQDAVLAIMLQFKV